MNIIARKDEIQQLQNAFDARKAEFIAVYGRRRIGKTFLIRQFFSHQDCLFFQITGIQKGKLAIQLREFTKELERNFYQTNIREADGFSARRSEVERADCTLPYTSTRDELQQRRQFICKEYKATRLQAPTNWHQAFEMLTEAIQSYTMTHPRRKIVLFFDELPWMARPKSQLLEALDYFWNRYWSQFEDLKLVICGSASSWIIDNILNNKGGLHNRVSLRLPLGPFSLSETKEFLHHQKILLNEQQIVQIYMVFGGIPYYLEHVERGFSATQIVNRLCFQEKGILFDEFKNLLASLYQVSDAYEELLRIIHHKPYGILRKEIEEKIKLSKKGGTLTKRLVELEQAGFIKKIKSPFKKRETAYQCIDEYITFYLRWIEPAKERHVDELYWESMFGKPAYYTWAGYAFELLCYKHISMLRKLLQIPAGSSAFMWRFVGTQEKEGAQLDLVFDRQDGVITLCEIKYTKNPYVIDKKYYKVLSHKVELLQSEMATSKQVFLNLISAEGLKTNEYSGIITRVITLKDLL